MKKNKSIKRILAGALAALMSISAVPMAFAAENPTGPVSETAGTLAGGVDAGHYVSFRSNKQYFTFIQTEDNQNFRFQFWLDAKKNAGVNYGWILTPQENGDYPQTLISTIGKSSTVTWDNYIGGLPGNFFGGNDWVGTTITVDFVGNGGGVYNTALRVWYDSGSTSGTDRNKLTYDIPLDVTVIDKRALNKAIDAANAAAADSAYYTEATWSDVQTALANAQSVAGDVIAEQTTIDRYSKALESAVASLLYKDADYSALTAAKAAAEVILNSDNPDANYPADTLATLREKYAAAVAIAENLDILQQSVIDNAAKALADAVASMVKFADYSAVEQALAVYSKLNASYYDEAELAKVTALADAATASLKNKLPEDQQAEVDKMAEDLLDAIAALELRDADTAKLAALITDAMEILSSDESDTYTTVSINALMEAVVAANEVLDAGLKIDQQAKVDAAEQELQNALTGLVKNPADKAALLTKLNEAKAIQGRADYKDYTEASRTALEAAIASAQAVYDDAKLTVDDQEKITAEVTKLMAAIRGMTWNPADYSKLDTAIEAREAEVAAAKEAVTAEGAKLYTEASIARVETAIELAKSLARDLTVKEQSQVDDMITTLNSVPLEKNAADYAALNKLIEEKQALLNNAGDEYTEESKTALQSAITAARAVVAAQYKIDEQSKVNDAVKALEVVGLELKDADFSALDAAIQAAKEFLADPETDKLYTADAIQKVKDALDEAETVRGEDLTILDQDKVADAADALNGAVAAAKGDYNPANVEALEAAVNAAKDKLNAEDIEDYTETSIQALEDAVAKAEALIAEKPDITRQDEVNAMADELNGMKLALKPADKAALEDAINAVEDMLDDSANYTEEFIKELEDALEDAYGVLEDDSLTIKDQDQVNEVVKDLTGKTEQPVYKDAVLTALDAAIAAAQAKIDAPDYQNYTEASRAVLEAALAEAVALRESNPNITQQPDVDAAAEKLNSVKLTLKGADYDDLNAAIAEVEALLGTNLSDTYTNTSIAALEAALEEAKNIAAGDYDASQQEIIDNALQALVNAKDALKTYTKVGNVTILGGDGREGDKIYHKTPWYQTYKSQKAELYVEIENPEDVVDIKWEAANWSIDEPEATITDNGDGTATIQPNGKGIGARSMWVKVTVTDVNGNVSTDIVKVRFYNWDWQK